MENFDCQRTAFRNKTLLRAEKSHYLLSKSSRKVYPQIPPKVEYSLTETGKTLEPIVLDMAKWGEYYKNLCEKNSD